MWLISKRWKKHGCCVGTRAPRRHSLHCSGGMKTYLDSVWSALTSHSSRSGAALQIYRGSVWEQLKENLWGASVITAQMKFQQMFSHDNLVKARLKRRRGVALHSPCKVSLFPVLPAVPPKTSQYISLFFFISLTQTPPALWLMSLCLHCLSKSSFHWLDVQTRGIFWVICSSFAPI